MKAYAIDCLQTSNLDSGARCPTGYLSPKICMLQLPFDFNQLCVYCHQPRGNTSPLIHVLLRRIRTADCTTKTTSHQHLAAFNLTVSFRLPFRHFFLYHLSILVKQVGHFRGIHL